MRCVCIKNVNDGEGEIVGNIYFEKNEIYNYTIDDGKYRVSNYGYSVTLNCEQFKYYFNDLRNLNLEILLYS